MLEINKYEIATIGDLLKVPDEKIDECLADLKMWIGVRKAYDELPEELRNFVKLQDTMIWKDDGVRGVSELQINIQTKD